MTANETLIHQFYTAFANSDAKQMWEYYHPNVQFIDPIFGLLNGVEVQQMWRMLIEKSKGNLKIEYSEIVANEFRGTAKCTAKYNFSKHNSPIENRIVSKFHFKDGLIIKQTDDFDIWKWAKQSMGVSGLLLGWTGFMQRKITNNARISLDKYQKSANGSLESAQFI